MSRAGRGPPPDPLSRQGTTGICPPPPPDGSDGSSHANVFCNHAEFVRFDATCVDSNRWQMSRMRNDELITPPTHTHTLLSTTPGR